MRADRRRDARSSLKAGDWLAFDGAGYVDGDIMFVRVLEVIPRFPRNIDRVGAAPGGYRVTVYSFDEPSPAEDNYGRDFVDKHCVRLSAEEMMRARCAGWPRTYIRFREVLGDRLPLSDCRGVPIGSLFELQAAGSRGHGWSS